jgi:hypothetical protein
MTGTRLGEILVRTGLITSAQIDEAIAAQRRRGTRLGSALLQLGHVSEDDIAWALSTQLKVPYVHLSAELVDPGAVSRVPLDVARWLELCPVLVTDDEITVAMADPTDESAVAEVERHSGLRVVSAIALASNIRSTLAALESRAAAPGATLAAPALRFHLSAAVAAGAEEIYFEPHTHAPAFQADRARVRVRYRTPGGLIASQGPVVEAGALDEIAKAPHPVRLRIPLESHHVEVTLRAAATPHGAAVFGALAVETDGPWPEEMFARLSEAIRRAGLLVVGSPDPTLRRTVLRALVGHAGLGGRVVIAGAPGWTPVPDAVDLVTPDPTAITESRAEFVLADAGGDLDLAAALVVGRRPGQVLVVGTPHVRAAHAVEDLVTRAGRLRLRTALAGIFCAAAVPALCRCATERRGTPAGWPAQPPPNRWAAPTGCDDCRQTGYDGYVVLHEWYPAGSELEHALAEASPFALADRIRPALAPSLAHSAREAVERLQTTAETVRDLLEV